MQNKIQISRHFKIKLELDPTRPDPPFPVNFLTRPAGRVKSRATLILTLLLVIMGGQHDELLLSGSPPIVYIYIFTCTFFNGK